MEYLTVEDVMMIHRAETGLTDPIVDFGLLESAVCALNNPSGVRRPIRASI